MPRRNGVRRMRIIELDVTDSTNEYIKRMGFKDDVIVTAKRQTAGRGTKGRSFVSDEGGVYLSVLRTYKNINPANAFKIMVSVCVAVCKTVESFSVKPKIRWANDVLVNGKKISGTLIENTISGKAIRSVAGIGINVNNEIPEYLKDTAINLSAAAAREISAGEVKSRLIKNLANDYTLSEYKSYINFFGKEILLKSAEGERVATALDVADDGRLKVAEKDGKICFVSAAEVSLKT